MQVDGRYNPQSGTVLRLAGVDESPYQAPQVQVPRGEQAAPGLNAVPAPSIRPMQQALQSTQQSLTDALTQYNQGLNAQAQRKLETVHAEQQAALKRSMTQAAANAQNGEVISSLAQTATQYLAQRQQADEAMKQRAYDVLKQQRKANYTAATVAAQELKSEAENGGYKEKGTTFYTQKFQEQVYSTDLDDEDRLALVQEFYKHRDSYEQQAREQRDKQVKDMRVAAREREKQQNILDLQPVFSAVKDNPYADPEVAMSKLREKITAVYANVDYTPTEKDDMTAALMREAIPYVSSNVQAQVKLARLQQDISDYKGYEADQVLQYQNGVLNRQQLLTNLDTFKTVKGLSGVTSYDPKADMEFEQFVQESTQKETDYTLKRSREAADSIVQVDDQAVNAYAIQLATSMGGSGIAELEARGQLTRGEQVVLLRAKKLVELRDKEAQLTQRLAKETESAAQVNYSTTKKAIDAANRGKNADTLVDQAANSTQKEQPSPAEQEKQKAADELSKRAWATVTPEKVKAHITQKIPVSLKPKLARLEKGEQVELTLQEYKTLEELQQQGAQELYQQELDAQKKDFEAKYPSEKGWSKFWSDVSSTAKGAWAVSPFYASWERDPRRMPRNVYELGTDIGHMVIAGKYAVGGAWELFTGQAQKELREATLKNLPPDDKLRKKFLTSEGGKADVTYSPEEYVTIQQAMLQAQQERDTRKAQEQQQEHQRASQNAYGQGQQQQPTGTQPTGTQPTGTLSPEQIRKLPESLRAKVIATQSGKKVKPYTPEELAAINNALAMQQQAAATSYSLAVQELEAVRRELAAFGLSGDVEATRKYMSDGFAKWSAYQKSWTETARGCEMSTILTEARQLFWLLEIGRRGSSNSCLLTKTLRLNFENDSMMY